MGPAGGEVTKYGDRYLLGAFPLSWLELRGGKIGWDGVTAAGNQCLVLITHGWREPVVGF